MFPKTNWCGKQLIIEQQEFTVCAHIVVFNANLLLVLFSPRNLFIEGDNGSPCLKAYVNAN